MMRARGVAWSHATGYELFNTSLYERNVSPISYANRDCLTIDVHCTHFAISSLRPAARRHVLSQNVDRVIIYICDSVRYI